MPGRATGKFSCTTTRVPSFRRCTSGRGASEAALLARGEVKEPPQALSAAGWSKRRALAVALSDYDYLLPPGAIAQVPLAERDASRLLVLDRRSGALAHRRYAELPELLRPGDLLVLNDTKVVPARLLGRKRGTGGRAELL